MTATKFFHSEDIYNLKSPREIVPVLVQMFQPKSVVDFGCGLGTFLYCFKEQGVPKVLGMDGEWVDKNLRRKYLDDDEFISVDLQKPSLGITDKFDLAISLEVAEHLPAASADSFIENITSLSDNVVFSAAIPGQGGQDHINEQWPSYWIPKFEKYGYKCHDVLRRQFWANPDIHWWYRQNMLVFSKEITFHYPNTEPPIVDIVHPGLLKANADNADRLGFALRLLTKVCLRKLGIKH